MKYSVRTISSYIYIYVLNIFYIKKKTNSGFAPLPLNPVLLKAQNIKCIEQVLLELVLMTITMNDILQIFRVKILS